MRSIFSAFSFLLPLTLAAGAESSDALAQTDNRPDHAVCLRALNSDQAGWDRSSTYAKDVAEADRRGLTIDACRQLLAQEVRKAESLRADERERLKHPDKSHPSFLEAGIFFMTGNEPPDKVKFQLRPDGDVSAIVIRLMLEPGRSAYDAKWEYKLSLDKPCTIMAYRIEPPYEIERLEFLNLPSPRAMRNDPTQLPHETWCHSKAYMTPEGRIDLVKGTSMCDRSIMIGHVYDAHRRLAALDYIRDNFCLGQPEPPPPPRKPY